MSRRHLAMQKLSALYWRRLRARRGGGDDFTVSREVLAEAMKDFDHRVLEAGTLGAELLRKYLAENGETGAGFFTKATGSRSHGSDVAKAYLQQCKTPNLEVASRIELYTHGMVPMETWLIGRGSLQDPRLREARLSHSRALRDAKRVAQGVFLVARYEVLKTLRQWIQQTLPVRFPKTTGRPKYAGLRDYAKAKGFLDAKEKFYERVGPRDAEAEDWRVLCDSSGCPIPPGDYDAALEAYSYASAQRRLAGAIDRSARVRERLGKVGRGPLGGGEEGGGTGPAGG